MAININQIGGASDVQSQYDEARQRMQALYGAAANYLGLSLPDLQKQMEAGKSLADIAAAQGKTTDGLKSALSTALQGAGGPAGANPQAFLDRVINARPGQGSEGHGHHHGGHHHGAIPVDPTNPDAQTQALDPTQTLSKIL